MPERPVDALFLEVQEALAGEYSLDRELGRGGMGVVYLAREVRLDREVALKVLPPEMAAAPELREQFVREAQMAARLSHPNIVPIHRVGEAGAFVYFAMVYVAGVTLGEQVRAHGPLAPEQAIKVLREVAWALTYAHTSGLVHRDVKPDNIMLETGSGRTLVTDFGIAHTSHTVDTLAGDGRVVGTAHYMSPEQAMGESVDARSDIYSLGVVAYYALTTRHPFEGGTMQSILARHLNETPLPIRTIAPAVPQRLAAAVERCLAKDPAQRFQRASEFADAIAQSIEPVRDIPPAIRVWLAREDKTRAPRIFGGLYGSGATAIGLGQATGSPLIGVLAGLAVATTAIAVPTIANTRKVLRAGYSLADLREAQLRHWSRRREELAVELGDTPPVTMLDAAKWVAGSIAVGVVAAILIPGPAARQVGVTIALMATVAGGVAGMVRRIRYKRAQLPTPPMVRLWGGKWGERIVKLASIRLRHVAPKAIAAQATEVALGRATDALYEALTPDVRKQLEHVPGTVRRLEKEAGVLRKLVSDIEASMASVDSSARQQASADVSALRADLQRAREETNGRLASTVAALETIRLGLIRLQLGTGDAVAVTATLDAARAVADDIERAADAQKEVERLLRNTSSLEITD